MTPHRANPSVDTSAPQIVAAVRQATPTLDRLLHRLVGNRAALCDELRAIPPKAARELALRRELLRSLEAYTAALGRRNLPVPPRLRDERALQRALVPTAPPPRGARPR